MNRPVGLHPEAILEAAAAAAWYEVRSQRAAAAFREELDAAIADIAEAPERWPSYVEGTRRRLFRRFPFYVVYWVGDDSIEVLAVAHGRRRPGYWRERGPGDGGVQI